MKVAAAAILTASLLPISCASAPSAKPGATGAGSPCAGLTPPRRLTTRPVPLPSSLTSVRVGGTVVDEAVIGPDGAVSDVRLVRTTFELLAPFGQKSVQDSLFQGGTIDGHPAAMRVRVSTSLGDRTGVREEPEYDSLWAHVPATTSREAAWQLAGSLKSLTLVVHVGTVRAGAEVVARTSSEEERVLEKLPPADRPIDSSQTVATGSFFERAGEYRLELRAAGKTLASTTLTVADDYTRAIVNTCDPI